MNTLKNIRIQRQLTQQDLAKIAGLSQTYVNKLENGKKTNPTKDTLFKLAKALEVPIADLLDIA